MGKLGKLWKGEHGGFFKYAAVVTGLFFLLLLFGPGPNLVRWARARIEIGRQEREIRKCRRDIREMERRYEALTTDRDSLEQFARETFRLASPGDDVYVPDK